MGLGVLAAVPDAITPMKGALRTTKVAITRVKNQNAACTFL